MPELAERTLSQRLIIVMRFLIHEIKKLSSLFIFFLIGFGYILLITKLYIETYDVNIYVFSRLIVAALVAAKAVVIIDATPLMAKFADSPRYIRLIYKSGIYTGAVLILGAIEGLIEKYHSTKALGPAIAEYFASRNFNRFLATVLSIGIIFFIHNIFREIEIIYGKGTVQKLFLEVPKRNSN